MSDIKQFLYAWLGKRKVTPNYDFSQTGAKHKPRFKCEVCSLHVYPLRPKEKNCVFPHA